MTDSPIDAPSAQGPLPVGKSLTITSAELFRGAKVISITHAGETYRLLITRNNRLILQK